MHNEILLGLTPKEREMVSPELEQVDLPAHSVLNELGQPIQYCFFVNSGLASVLSVMSDGKSVEVGLAGQEGFIGLPLVVGLRSSSTRVVMQVAGDAFRMSASGLSNVLRQCPQLEKRLKLTSDWRAGCS
jgi:CRP-like cAMP-binding protein